MLLFDFFAIFGSMISRLTLSCFELLYKVELVSYGLCGQIPLTKTLQKMSRLGLISLALLGLVAIAGK